MLLMDFSISSKRNVSAFQATFFEMLNAWSASCFPDMTRISRGMNQRACKDCAVAFVTHFQPRTGPRRREPIRDQIVDGSPFTRSTCDSRNLFSCQFVYPQHRDVQHQRSWQRRVTSGQNRCLR